MTKSIAIRGSTRVAELLDCYPELEDVLISLAPPFKKLKNPILRKSVAKVATLRQASAVARLPVTEVVNALRDAVGQERLSASDEEPEAVYTEDRPDWFHSSHVVESLDEREIDPDVMPLLPLLRRAQRLRGNEIVELVTTYLPAPGIDAMRKKGFRVWSLEDPDAGLVRTYFAKPAP